MNSGHFKTLTVNFCLLGVSGIFCEVGIFIQLFSLFITSVSVTKSLSPAGAIAYVFEHLIFELPNYIRICWVPMLTYNRSSFLLIHLIYQIQV